MKKFSPVLIVSLIMIAAIAKAQMGAPGHRMPHDQWGNGGFMRHVNGYFEHRNGRVYQDAPRICGVTNVFIEVVGDNVEIRDFDILFGNGDTQEIYMREHFSEKTISQWKDLDGEARCIEGFFINARSDRDFDNAAVILYGYSKTNSPRVIQIGRPLVIRDFNRLHDDFRRRGGGGRPGNPGGFPPPPPHGPPHRR